GRGGGGGDLGWQHAHGSGRRAVAVLDGTADHDLTSRDLVDAVPVELLRSVARLATDDDGGAERDDVVADDGALHRVRLSVDGLDDPDGGDQIGSSGNAGERAALA